MDRKAQGRRWARWRRVVRWARWHRVVRWARMDRSRHLAQEGSLVRAHLALQSGPLHRVRHLDRAFPPDQAHQPRHDTP